MGRMPGAVRRGLAVLVASLQLALATTPQVSRRSVVMIGAQAAGLWRAATAPAEARERAQNARPGLGLIYWGGATRCDPTDPSCAQEGRMGGNTPSTLTVPQPRATATSRAFFDLAIDRRPAGCLTFALYGAECPASVANFRDLCRGALARRPGEEPASYLGSTVVQVQPGRCVIGGSLVRAGGRLELLPGSARPRFVPSRPDANDDKGVGSLDEAGLLAMRRGGGDVSYLVTLGKAPGLDRDWVVIGQIADEESAALLARLASVPVNRYDGGPLLRTEVVACDVRDDAPSRGPG